jgi:hypothetical protein
LGDILGELEDAFGWKSTELYELGRKNKKDDFSGDIVFALVLSMIGFILIQIFFF